MNKDLFKLAKDPDTWQRNELTLARYDISGAEINVLAALFAQLDRNKPEPDLTYTLSLRGLLGSGAANEINYSRAKETTRLLLTRVLEFTTGSRLRQTSIISRADYEEGSGEVVISIDPEVAKYLFNIREHTTRFYLEHILALRGRYAKRLYQIFSQWKSLEGSQDLYVNELRHYFKLETKYKSFTSFWIRVMEPAILQINSLTDITVDLFEPIKQGKKIIGWKVNVTWSKPRTDRAHPKELAGKITSLYSFKLRHDQVAAILDQLDPKLIAKAIYQIKTSNGILNIGGYAWKIFTDFGVKLNDK